MIINTVELSFALNLTPKGSLTAARRSQKLRRVGAVAQAVRLKVRLNKVARAW